MEIYRGPQSTGQLRHTDSKKPKEYAKKWQSNPLITFNVTIEGGERFSTLGVRIGEDDVLALSAALVRRYRLTQFHLNRELKTSRAEATRLRNALAKIDRLISYHHREVPSPEVLVQTAQNIARHYRWSSRQASRNSVGSNMIRFK